MKSNSLKPELYVTDFKKSLSFYTEILGFTVKYQRENPSFAFLSYQSSQIMIQEIDPNEDKAFITGTYEYPLGRGINFQIETDNIEKLDESLKSSNYPLRRDLQDSWYKKGNILSGSRQILIQDPDGYLLRFSQDLGEKKNSMTKEEIEKDLEERTSSKGFLMYAKQYYRSFKLLDKAEPHDIGLFAVKYFLLCRTMELTIKAFLRDMGYSRKRLMGLGHDLEKLIEKLHDKHDILMDVEGMKGTFVANQYYKLKMFEYPIIGYKEVPSLESMQRTIELLLGMVTMRVEKLGPLA